MKLGVIGGLGPLATAYFFELLINMSDVDNDQDHLEILIHNCPSIPDRTQYILHKSNDNPVIPMIKVGKGLIDQGCDLISIPCITAHYFHKELSTSLSQPIVHLVEELALFLKKHNYNKVGIMATDGTINSCLFQIELSKYGIEAIVPDSIYQKDVMHIIYDNVKKGRKIDMNCFERVSNHLKQKEAEIVVLGCTELSIVKKNVRLDHSFLDAMELLSAVSLKKCGMKIKDEYRYLVE